MNFLLLVRWLLLVATVFGAQVAAAQTSLSEGAERAPSSYAHPLETWTQPEPDHSRGKIRDRRADAETSLMHKLQSIVIPRIEFRDTTLADAVEFLRQQSHLLDTDPNPDTRGVNISLQLPEYSPSVDGPVGYIPGLSEPAAAPSSVLPAKVADPKALLTLTMTRLPLLEALKYVALQAGMKVEVGKTVVDVVPVNNTIPALTTVEYLVPPELLGLSADIHKRYPEEKISVSDTPSSGRVTIRCLDRMAWFESKGVSFPPGAKATYVLSYGRLVIRNTQENLDKIVSVISSALKPVAPASENP